MQLPIGDGQAECEMDYMYLPNDSHSSSVLIRLRETIVIETNTVPLSQIVTNYAR